MADADPLLRNPIIAAVMDDLDGGGGVDAVQRHLDFVRAQIAENSAIYADAAPQLAQANRRLAEALFAAAAARHAPPEEQQKTQQPPALPELAAELEEPDEEEMEEPGEEEMDGLAAALAAEFAEAAARAFQILQEEGEEAVVQLQMDAEADPEMGALAADCLEIAARVERCRQNHRILAQAHGFLLLVRAVGFALTRAHLLPGVLLTVAAAYALAYAASGGAVAPGPASLLRIAALVLCFLFGVPVVGNLA